MEEKNKVEIVKSESVENVSYDIQLRDFENGLQNFLTNHNLPAERIFVGIQERVNVFKNIDSVLNQVDYLEKEKSIYLSKFIAGVA